MEKYYDQETLLKVQKVQSCILKDVINVCLKYEIDIFMVFGSALGVVRHQGFIPWDTDTDVGMLRSDYALFLEKGVPELPQDIFFRLRKQNRPWLHGAGWLRRG